jgi:hypothetical protein
MVMKAEPSKAGEAGDAQDTADLDAVWKRAEREPPVSIDACREARSRKDR